MKKYKSPEAQSLEIQNNQLAADTSSVEIPDGNIGTDNSGQYFPGHW